MVAVPGSDVPAPQRRRDHPVRLHARQGAPPHHLRLRDDPGAMDPQQSCGPPVGPCVQVSRQSSIHGSAIIFRSPMYVFV